MNGVLKPLLFTLWLQAGAKFFPSLTRTHTHTHNSSLSCDTTLIQDCATNISVPSITVS